MKMAKVKDGPWVTWSDKGWVNSKGEVVEVSASPKKTKFYKDEVEAKVHGYVKG